MKIVKKLVVAGVTALSLGTGAAIAQESPSGGVPDYWAEKYMAWHHATASNTQRAASQTQSFMMKSGSVNLGSMADAAMIGDGPGS